MRHTWRGLWEYEPTGQLDAFSQAVGEVRKYYHHAKLQRRSLSQVKVFEKLTRELGNLNWHKQQQQQEQHATNVTETSTEFGYKWRDESSEGSQGGRTKEHVEEVAKGL